MAQLHIRTESGSEISVEMKDRSLANLQGAIDVGFRRHGGFWMDVAVEPGDPTDLRWVGSNADVVCVFDAKVSKDSIHAGVLLAVADNGVKLRSVESD